MWKLGAAQSWLNQLVRYSMPQFYPVTARNTNKICTFGQQIYCLSVSNNPTSGLNSVHQGQLPVPPFWMALYLHWGTPKSSKMSTFSHKMGKKCLFFFVGGLRGWGFKFHFWGHAPHKNRSWLWAWCQEIGLVNCKRDNNPVEGDYIQLAQQLVSYVQTHFYILW